MITNISLVTLWVTDQDAAKKFYTDTMGFVEGTDVTLGDGFRWVSILHPDHPELQVTLAKPGPPLSDDTAEAIRRALDAGTMGGFGLATNDCHATYRELAAKGVEFVQQPAERPYGIEAVMRDNSGNWLVLVEAREFTGESLPH
ncbi:MAG: VOC family protein [Rhodococcus sp. (in: high G+C Gram-positive bacteria)]|uniref:VOC family protein n=1 Tax=Rhodococcus sp. TaxID=1831 RepID=UPI003D9AD0AC